MAEFRGRIYDSITETIGATPPARLARLAGIPCGISPGAAVHAALVVGARPDRFGQQRGVWSDA